MEHWKAWREKPLPKWFDPLEKGLRNFFIISSIGVSIYALCTIQEWAINLETRLKHPDWESSLNHPVTEMDYVWIIGLGVIFLLAMLATAFCRYILKKGHWIHVTAGASVLAWALDTVHPLLLTYVKEPFVQEGTEAFFYPFHIISHLMPGVFFGMSLVLWATMVLYGAEWCVRKAKAHLWKN